LMYLAFNDLSESRKENVETSALPCAEIRRG